MQQEKDLVRRAKGGEARAFEEIVSQYESKVYAMGLRFTGNEQDALDICQEVFLRVYRFIGSFNEESRLSTWLYRIAANVCKDTAARRSRMQEQPLESDDQGEGYTYEIADSRFSPEDTLLQAELQQSIVNAILELPERYREVVILRDINGLSYEQIAQALELELGTVKSRIARARERLRVFLLADGNIRGPQLSKEVKGGKTGA